MLEELYKKYFHELSVYIYSLCKNQGMTEDILQETFLKAFTALKDSHTNMRAWLYMVARNLYINRMKKERPLILSDQIEVHNNGHQIQEDILTGVIRNEKNRILFDALEHLPPQKREILLLQYFGAFSQREIAAMLQLTPENVRVLSHRAKKEIKKYLEVKHYDLS